MQAAGLDAWWDSEELALFGLVEVLAHIPRLLKLRKELTHRLQALSPDVFIGIDAPDFNLGLEIKLRRSWHPHDSLCQPDCLGLAQKAGAQNRARRRPGSVPVSFRTRIFTAIMA